MSTEWPEQHIFSQHLEPDLGSITQNHSDYDYKRLRAFFSDYDYDYSSTKNNDYDYDYDYRGSKLMITITITITMHKNISITITITIMITIIITNKIELWFLCKDIFNLLSPCVKVRVCYYNHSKRMISKTWWNKC